MEAPGFLLYTPPTALKGRFVMVEEHSKVFYDVDLITPRLQNPTTWLSEGITPANSGSNLAIVIPDGLDQARKDHIERQGSDPDFETGKLVCVTSQEGHIIDGRVIGQVNVCPSKIMSWQALERDKGAVLADEVKNGLLGKVFGDVDVARSFVHPQVLAGMPRPWHQDPIVLNAELDGIFASGRVIETGSVRWMLTEDDDSD